MFLIIVITFDKVATWRSTYSIQYYKKNFIFPLKETMIYLVLLATDYIPLSKSRVSSFDFLCEIQQNSHSF